MPPITPELITTWAASIAAAVGTIGVALKKAGLITLHKRGNSPKAKPKTPEATGVICSQTGLPCASHDMLEKRVTDTEKAMDSLVQSVHKMEQDIAFIRGNIEHLMPRPVSLNKSL